MNGQKENTVIVFQNQARTQHAHRHKTTKKENQQTSQPTHKNRNHEKYNPIETNVPFPPEAISCSE